MGIYGPIKEWDESMDYYLYINSSELSQPRDLGVTKECSVEFNRIGKQELPSLYWLARAIAYKREHVIELVSTYRHGYVKYCLHKLPKKRGGVRIIYEPTPYLKKFQKHIQVLLVDSFSRDKRVNGFSGGNVISALSPHLNSSCWMMVDIEEAFPSITQSDLKAALYWKNNGPFSLQISRLICEMCLFDKKLPQGAPTSPVLFDYAFRQVDQELKVFAERRRIIYSRYADNLLFSKKGGKIKNAEKWRILEIIEGQNRKHLPLQWHKLKIRHSCSEAIRMLGLNLIKGQLHNTRQFKRRLRFLVNYTEWLIQNNRDYLAQYYQLTGMWGFCVKEALPAKLTGKIENILKHH